MKKDIKKIYDEIKILELNIEKLDKKELEEYKRSRENYIKNSKGIKKYIEIYNKIQKEDFFKKENKKYKKERKLSFSKSKKSNIKINSKEEIYEIDDLVNNINFENMFKNNSKK